MSSPLLKSVADYDHNTVVNKLFTLCMHYKINVLHVVVYANLLHKPYLLCRIIFFFTTAPSLGDSADDVPGQLSLSLLVLSPDLMQRTQVNSQ